MYAPSWDQVIMIEESFGASVPHDKASTKPIHHHQTKNPNAPTPCLGILPRTFLSTLWKIMLNLAYRNTSSSASVGTVPERQPAYRTAAAALTAALLSHESLRQHHADRPPAPVTNTSADCYATAAADTDAKQHGHGDGMV